MLKNLILYLPGFPGEAVPRHAGEIRVVDIVSKSVRQKNLHFEVICYPGIIKNGLFTFKNTKQHVLSVIKDKISQGYSVTLIGQSWGGLLSLLALNQFKINQILLITPFLLNIPIDEIKNILKEYSNEFPRLIPLESIEENSVEIQSIMTEFANTLLKDNNQTEIKIFANTQDEIIPAGVINDLILTSNLFKSNVTLTTSINDHNFSSGFDDLEKWLINLLRQESRN